MNLINAKDSIVQQFFNNTEGSERKYKVKR